MLRATRQRFARQDNLDNTTVHAISGEPALRTRCKRAAQLADPDDNSTLSGSLVYSDIHNQYV